MKKQGFALLIFSLFIGCSSSMERTMQSTEDQSERTLCEKGTGPLLQGDILRFSKSGAIRTARGSRIGTMSKTFQENGSDYEIDLSFESAKPAERLFKAEEKLEVAGIKDTVVSLRAPGTVNASYELKCFKKLSKTSRTETDCTHSLVSVFFKQVKSDNCTVLEVQRSGQTSP